MPSSLIIEVVQIDDVQPHPNADRLDFATIKGWQCVVKKGDYKAGDKVVYFPPDTVLPKEVGERLGVDKYLDKGRVKSINLRGERSFGLIVDCDDPNWKIGKDVADHYKATKYDPPEAGWSALGGQKQGYSDKDHLLFTKFTDVENWRNYPDWFQEGEPVIFTEKIHGTNWRGGLVANVDTSGYRFMAGSHNKPRKRPKGLVLPDKIGLWERILDFFKKKPNKSDAKESSLYWAPFIDERYRDGVINLLQTIQKERKAKSVILYGEIYGWIQDLHYGHEEGKFSFIAFGLKVDEKYMDFMDFKRQCGIRNIPTVPVIYSGPFSIEKMKEYAEGETALAQAQIKEGIVIYPEKESVTKEGKRKVLKYISNAYLDRKGGSEYR